uniref:Uncharacterized protein n=1 Tax=Panagrolaimus superbus TaxID=310955 RepID=A0A914Z181_9BILA
MHFFIIFAFIFCFNFVTGLKCVTTSEDGETTSNSECLNSKYCYTFQAKLTSNAIKLDETIHGCGSTIIKVNDPNSILKTCDQYGVR